MPSPPSFESALAFARDLIRIPSPPGGEGEVAARVAREMEALAFDEVRTDEAGNVIGVVRGTGKGPSVMLSCHLDVVAEGDATTWEHPPYSGEIQGGFLHGRGAMDIKGPLAIQTYAALALRGRAAGDVVVAHTVFEERGGLGMRHLLETGGLRPDLVVIGEATHGDLCVGHRGRAELEVVIGGVAGHASAPERARNALDLLPLVLAAVRVVASEQPFDPLLGAATLVATDVDALPASRNVIPDRVTVALDWRVLPEQRPGELVSRVEEALAQALAEPPEGYSVEVRLASERQETYTGIECQRELFTPGFLMAVDDPVVQAVAAAVGRRDGSGPARVRPWTFATDGGWCAGVFGIPTVGFAPGEERFAHTNRERLDLDEARWAFDRYPALVLAGMEALEKRSRATSPPDRKQADQG